MFSSAVPQVVLVVVVSLSLCSWAEAFVAVHHLARQSPPVMSALTELGHSTPTAGRDVADDTLPRQTAAAVQGARCKVQGLGEVVSQYDSFLIGEPSVRFSHRSACLRRFEQLEAFPCHT